MNQIGFKAVRVQDCSKKTAIEVLKDKLGPHEIKLKDITDTFVIEENKNESSVKIELNTERLCQNKKFRKQYKNMMETLIRAYVISTKMDELLKQIFSKEGFGTVIKSENR